ATAADAVAVDRGDDGLGVRVVLQQGVVDDGGERGIGGEVAGQVGARAEGPVAGTGQDDTAIARPLERVPRGGQLCHHLARHGVAAGLVVDGDDGDVRAVRLDADLHGGGARPDQAGRGGPKAYLAW